MSNKQAKSSKARFRSLSDPETLAKFAQNLGEGIYITNETGEILDANAAFLKIFGVATLDELKNYRVSDFVDWEARKGEVALLEREGSLRDRELQITRRDGVVRTVLDTWYINRDPESGERIFHGILVDITNRKALEDQLVEQSIRDPPPTPASPSTACCFAPGRTSVGNIRPRPAGDQRSAFSS